MKNILIVEDTKTWQEMIKYYLSENMNDVELNVVGSLSEAKVAIQSQNFDVAILDLCLPDAPNGEIVDYVISKNIPVWILSGSVDDKVKKIFISKPIVDYVIKDGYFTLDYLVTSLKRFFENKNRYVLVVDDSKSFRLQYQSNIINQNLNCILAEDGEIALSILKSNPQISLVLTDYEMPKMNGIELCKEIRKIQNKDQLSIIAISGSNEELAPVFLKNGANDFLAKPFSKEEFLCRVNQNIDMLHNIQSIKDMADKDFLTGIYNRRYCFLEGVKTWDKMIKKQEMTSVMLDIDHFKKINDTYGHDVGDIAIKTLANILKEFSNSHKGIAFRLGGEEFAVILPFSIEESKKELLILKDIVEKNKIKISNLEISFTISIGANTVGKGSKISLDDSLKASDLNLYEVKKNGRNNLVITSD